MVDSSSRITSVSKNAIFFPVCPVFELCRPYEGTTRQTSRQVFRRELEPSRMKPSFSQTRLWDRIRCVCEACKRALPVLSLLSRLVLRFIRRSCAIFARRCLSFHLDSVLCFIFTTLLDFLPACLTRRYRTAYSVSLITTKRWGCSHPGW